MQIATSQADRELARSRAMFRRALAGWASDLLTLRAKGLDRPGVRGARRLLGQGKGPRTRAA